MSIYPSDEDKLSIRISIILLALAVAAALLASCGEARSPEPQPEPGPAAVLGHIGATLAWAGAISTAAGLALSVISLFYAPLKPFAVLFRWAGLGGAAISATGAAYLWISQHYWWILALAAVVGLGIGWWFWPRIHRAVEKRLQAR